jgi:hypothetical protein
MESVEGSSRASDSDNESSFVRDAMDVDAGDIFIDSYSDDDSDGTIYCLFAFPHSLSSF